MDNSAACPYTGDAAMTIHPTVTAFTERDCGCAKFVPIAQKVTRTADMTEPMNRYLLPISMSARAELLMCGSCLYEIAKGVVVNEDGEETLPFDYYTPPFLINGRDSSKCPKLPESKKTELMTSIARGWMFANRRELNFFTARSPDAYTTSKRTQRRYDFRTNVLPKTRKA